MNGAIIEALSPEGRVTVRILQVNNPEYVDERLGLIEVRRYPCKAEESQA